LDHATGDARPDAIKIDIEGAEGLFLHGARGTIQRCQPTLLFEINPELLHAVSHIAASDLQHWLQEQRYKLWAVEPHALSAGPPTQNVGDMIGHRGMKNFLAIHIDRIPSVCARIGATPS